MKMSTLGLVMVSCLLLSAGEGCVAGSQVVDDEATGTSSDALILTCGASVKRGAFAWGSAQDSEPFQSKELEECQKKTLSPGVLTAEELAARKKTVRLQAEANAIADCQNQLNAIAKSYTCATKLCTLTTKTLSPCTIKDVTEDLFEDECIQNFPGGYYLKTWTIQFSALAVGSIALTCTAPDGGVESGTPDTGVGSTDTGTTTDTGVDTGIDTGVASDTGSAD